MSSLAGALDPLPTHHQVASDVDMAPPDDASLQAGLDAGAAPQDEEMGDLFGEEDDVDYVKHEQAQSAPAALSAPDTKSPTPSSPLPEGLSSPDRRQRQALEYEEEDEPNELVEHRLEAAVAIPNVPVPKSSDDQHWVIRMPNFVKVDSKPFHPDTYIGPEHEETNLLQGSRERDMGIKLTVENTVRWRWVKDQDGHDRRQSNARVIRWSDGSLSLRLGKEYFDISQVIDNSGSTHRNAFGMSASQSQSQAAPPMTPSASQTQPLSQSQSGSSSSKSHGLTYLVAQHKRAEILQAEAVVTGYMTLRPTDMQSETHRLLVRAVGQKHSKVARLKMAPDPAMDPEREKQELMRQAAKKPRRSRGEDGRSSASARRRRHSAARRRSGEGIWSDDEEEGVESEEGWEEGGDDDEGTGRSAKRRRHADADARGRGDYETDDFVVADSDEEGNGAHGADASPSKRRKRARDGDAEEDVLDKLDKQIGEQEEERRRQRRADGNPEGDEDAEVEMEVESEEEEEFRVHHTGGARKRRIDFDDDDDE
ncbi:Leo1-domain-containing protein [Dentipellis sp. KUC8613]|nr:Leo1-domain-containing protein [Dentipellis sp. KUC8613]